LTGDPVAGRVVVDPGFALAGAVSVPGGNLGYQLGECNLDGDVEASRDVSGAGCPLVGVAGCDDGQSLGQGLGCRQVGQAFVDEGVGEGPGLFEVAA